MDNPVLFLMLISSHLLGDFYFQSDLLARNKKSSFKHLIFHSLIYAGVIALGCFFMQLSWVYIAIAVLSHFLLDTLKWTHEKSFDSNGNNAKTTKIGLFALDQIGHLLFLFLISIANPLAEFQSFLPALSDAFMGWITVLLLIAKPANVSFDVIFAQYAVAAKTVSITRDPINPKSSQPHPEVEGAGATIGTMERIITVILVGVSQFGGLALLMAAKSLARFEKISQQPTFAEYYLIGTLYSLMFAIVAYYFVFKVILVSPVVVDPTQIIILTPTPMP